jgi:hypothetical protein
MFWRTRKRQPFLFAENSDTMSNRLLQDLSTEEAIVRCGELKIDKQQIPLLLSDRFKTKEEREAFARSLASPNSIEYILYAQGAAEGELKLAITLDNHTENPKAKDAYKNQKEERARLEINRKIFENFGIGEDI